MNLISKEFIRTIAPQLDLLNTVGGGIAQVQLRVHKQERGMVIRVSAPSVRPESFHVVLNERKLTIFCEFRHQSGGQLGAPFFTHTIDLPESLDLSGIEALHTERELQVRIPG